MAEDMALKRQRQVLKMKIKKFSFPKISFKEVSAEKKKEILKSALTVALASIAAAIVLGGVSNLLGEIAAKNADKRVYDAMERLMPDATYEKLMPGFDSAASFVTLYEAKKNGELSGYCVRTSSQGYENLIDMLVALDTEGKVIGVEILSIDETIGYGKNIEGEEFLSQFEGKNEELAVVRGKADVSSKISAVSGATVSSNAVKEGVNRAIATVSQLRADAEEKAAAEAKAAEELLTDENNAEGEVAQ